MNDFKKCMDMKHSYDIPVESEEEKEKAKKRNEKVRMEEYKHIHPLKSQWKSFSQFDKSLNDELSDDRMYKYVDDDGRLKIDKSVYNRLLGFLELKELLENSKETIKYNKYNETGNLLKSEYLILKVEDDYGLYLSVCRYSDSVYYTMNSLICETVNPDRLKERQKVYPLEFIAKIKKFDAPAFLKTIGVVAQKVQ